MVQALITNCRSGCHAWVDPEHASYCCQPHLRPYSASREELAEMGAVGIHEVGENRYEGWIRRTRTSTPRKKRASS